MSLGVLLRRGNCLGFNSVCVRQFLLAICELAAGVGKGEEGCCLVLSMMLVFMMSVVVLMVWCAPADLPVGMKEQLCIIGQLDTGLQVFVTDGESTLVEGCGQARTCTQRLCVARNLGCVNSLFLS